MDRKVGIVIQARMGSKRFPGKVLSDFCGKPLLQFQVDRIRSFGLPYQTLVATSMSPADNAVSEFCADNGIPCFRGDEENVLQRFIDVAQAYEFENLVRLTGDNPLVEHAILKGLIEIHLDRLPDLTSTREILPDDSVRRFAPKGKSVDVIKGDSLRMVQMHDMSEFEREHVIPVFYRRDGYCAHVVKDFANLEDREYSIDTHEDHEKLSLIAREELAEVEHAKGRGVIK